MGTVEKSTTQWPNAFKKSYAIEIPVPVYRLEYLKSPDAVDIEHTSREVDITETIGYSIQELLDYGVLEEVLKKARSAGQLNLSYQKINRLEGLKNIPNIANMCSLNLSNNHLSTLSQETFQGLGELKFLYLNNNQIASIAQGAFQGLAALTDLDLSLNKVATIDKDTFQGFAALQRLCLDHNQIASIAQGAFQGLTALQKLYLNDNQITQQNKKEIREALNERVSICF